MLLEAQITVRAPSQPAPAHGSTIVDPHVTAHVKLVLNDVLQVLAEGLIYSACPAWFCHLIRIV